MASSRKPRRGALIDLDGTLVKTEGLHRKAWTMICRKRDADFSAFPYEKIIGHSGLPVCQAVIDHFNLDIWPEALLKEYRAQVNALIAVDPELCLLPGARKVLDILQGLKVPIALVTASGDLYVQQMLDRFDLWPFFQALITREHPGWGKGKPHADPYLAAAEAIGRRIDECAVFEDSPPGIVSGLAAGAGYVFGIPHEHSPREGLIAATAILGSLEEFRPDMIGL